MKRVVKIALISLASLTVLALVTVAIMINFIFTSTKLTPLVNNILNEIITDGRAEINSVELTFFSSFPNFSLVLDSVSLIDNNSTPLLTLERASLSLNPVAYLTSKAIKVSNLTLQSPIINIAFDSLGKSSLDIFKVENSIPDSTTNTSTDTIFNSIEIKKIAIEDGSITISDKRNNSISSLIGLDFELSGNLSKANTNLMMMVNAKSINIEANNKKLLSNFPFAIKTDMSFNSDSLTLRAKNAEVVVGNITLSANGSIQADTTTRELICDLNFSLATPTLSTLIGYIPQTILKPHQQFSASGDVNLSGTIKGTYGKNTIPTIDVHSTIKGGAFHFDKMKYGVQKLESDITLKIDGTNSSNSFVEVSNFILDSNAGASLKLSGKITNLLDNFKTQFDITSNINLDRAAEIFPLVDGIEIKGSNTTNLKGKFTKHILESADYGSMYLDGRSEFNDLLLTIDGSKLADSTSNTYLYIEMKNGSFNFGNNSKIAKVTEGEANIAAEINFSGVGFRNKSGMDIFLSNVNLSAAAQLKKANSEITPMIGELTLGKINFAIADTLKAYLSSSSATIKIEPSSQSSKKADLSLSLRTDSASLNAIQSKTEAALRVAALKLNLHSDTTLSTKYSLNGTVGFGGLTAFSQQFPIKVSMSGSSVTFKDSRINLNKSSLTIGESSVVLTGWIENLLGNLFETSTKDINSNLSISSPNIDLAELYMASLKASTSISNIAKIEEEIKTDPTEAMQILLIPQNISSSLSLNVEKISFGELKAEKIDGKLELKQGTITLNNFNFFTAGANMGVSGKYHLLSDSLATATFSLSAKKIVIKELIKLIPAIDSIMPVLNSLDGTINFDMAARTNIDHNMSINLPSLESVMKLSGTDLSLMDGDTFRQISKMLMFKNKAKNTIDSLGVNIVVHKGGRINVPPFEIEIDRYRAIVGGTQILDFKNFDINYAYNVSIIKSPLPIKAGVDIKGKNGDFDFKITKAKLKRSDFTEIQTNVDSIRNSILQN